jgi:hypothetical protein
VKQIAAHSPEESLHRLEFLEFLREKLTTPARLARIRSAMSKAAARNVLEKLDSKPFGFFHLKMIVVSA